MAKGLALKGNGIRMNGKEVRILGAGLCSSLGGYKEACAASRAGIVRFSGDATFAFSEAGVDQPTALTIAPAASNFHLFQGLARTVKMLESAYEDFRKNCWADLDLDGLVILCAFPDPQDRGLELDVPENITNESRLQNYLEILTSKLFPLVNPGLSLAPLQCVFGERVAFARIMEKSVRMIADGKAKQCLLISSDSLLGDEFLNAQLDSEQLKTDDNPVGYIPGEGASFILLDASRSKGVSTEISVSMDNSTIETNDDRDKLWQSEKLASVVKNSIDTSKLGKIFPQCVVDTNGEEFRAKEFGILSVKLKSEYPDVHFLEPKIPTLSFAETGAMAGPLAFLTILASVERGYANHNEFLVLLSEYNGKRAAIHIKYTTSEG